MTRRHNHHTKPAPDTITLTDMLDGNCANGDLNETDSILFPAGVVFRQWQIDAAQQLCHGCPIKDQCYGLGIDTNAIGIWGGVPSYKWGQGEGPNGERSVHGTIHGVRQHERTNTQNCRACAAYVREQAALMDRHSEVISRAKIEADARARTAA